MTTSNGGDDLAARLQWVTRTTTVPPEFERAVEAMQRICVGNGRSGAPMVEHVEAFNKRLYESWVGVVENVGGRT